MTVLTVSLFVLYGAIGWLKKRLRKKKMRRKKKINNSNFQLFWVGYLRIFYEYS